MSKNLLCICAGPATTWIEQEPHSLHDYRVECTDCRHYKFPAMKEELDKLIATGVKVVVFPHHRPTLDQFFA